MVQSAQVYRYELMPTYNEASQRLGERGSITEIRHSKNPDTLNDPVELHHRIDHFRIQGDGYGGTLHLESYEKAGKRDGENYYEVDENDYPFFVYPPLQIIVIYCPTTHRPKAKRLISQFLNNSNEPFFEEIFIDKNKMQALINRIKALARTKNNIDSVTWIFDSQFTEQSGRRILSRLTNKQKRDVIKTKRYDTHGFYCASESDNYPGDFARASKMSPFMRIYRCNGIYPQETLENVEQRILSITYDASFHFSRDAGVEHWNLFIRETCARALTD